MRVGVTYRVDIVTMLLVIEEIPCIGETEWLVIRIMMGIISFGCLFCVLWMVLNGLLPKWMYWIFGKNNNETNHQHGDKQGNQPLHDRGKV